MLEDQGRKARRRPEKRTMDAQLPNEMQCCVQCEGSQVFRSEPQSDKSGVGVMVDDWLHSLAAFYHVRVDTLSDACECSVASNVLAIGFDSIKLDCDMQENRIGGFAA
ncbi:hypothetical protein AcW1_004164 [Taiwanofungus camphoratus]|nr:hypothetical protein AcW2_006824 [Antrodia cinnamomea]KAI0939015.1 hypothetical protein AcV5_000545 [Antrodia cinnamomea]KAI0951934.1 hypothetical protein AcV7_007887 [Antrodia cinnamomea]KAI0959305.1 hypothetical protein AcW1_004164 [Antrodia cinnamomea]